LPKGPLTPISSPASNPHRASVASPTERTVTEDSPSRPMVERDMGTSSTPGAQTITYWPGDAKLQSMSPK